MSSQKLFLKPDLVFEPLLQSWYAWPLLLAPASGSRIIANAHVKLMESFVKTPAIHVAASKNPAMRGGPFLDLPANRASEVAALLDATRTEQGKLLAFAEALQQLNDMLLGEARGFSLEGLYEKVPETLKGYVELYYDLNHRPNFRLIEALLYKSPYYDPSFQSISLWTLEKADRPFAFSTPRLTSERALNLPIPFHHEAIDALAQMRSEARPLEEIAEILGVEGEDREKLAGFLTEHSAPQAPRFEEEGGRIRYVGHASILVEANGLSLLTDPAMGYKKSHDDTDNFSYADLPPFIDYVLISHTHPDHVVFETLLQLRHKIGTIIVPKSNGGSLEDPSLRLMLGALGFKVREIDDLETIDVGGVTVTGVPFLGEHSDLNVRSKTGFMIGASGKKILCLADSANIENRMYQHIGEALGEVDVLFLGMECDGAPLSWVYGPFLMKPVDRRSDQSRTLSASDCQRGMGIVNTLNCKEVYVYAMGQEPWLCFLTSIFYTPTSKPIVESDKLVKACREKGLHAERLLGVKEIRL